MYEKSKITFSNLKDHAKSIASLLKAYSDKIEFTGFSGVEPYLSSEVTANLKYVDTNAKEVHMFPNKVDYKFLFEVYAQLMTIYEKVARIMQIYLENKVDLSRQGTYTSTGTSLTMTYIQDLNNTLTEIESSFLKFSANIKAINLLHNIIEDISENLSGIKISEINSLNKLYADYVKENQGNLVVDLYTHILHEVILHNTGTTAGKEIIKQVNRFIEELKTDVLDPAKVSQQNKINVIQRLVQMHNLVPTSISNSLDEIFKDLDVTYDDKLDLHKNLLKVIKMTKDKNICFIIINKIIKKPLEHNIWTLINEEYIDKHKLILPPDVGMCAKILERGQTIKYMPVTKAKDGLEIIGEVLDDSFVYILETLNGESYRFLSAWNFPKAVPMPMEWFKNFDNKEKCPSQRVSGYNDIINEEILKHIKKPALTVTDINNDEIKKPPAYWKSLKDRIKKFIVNDIVKVFVERFIEGDQKLTIENINQIISNEEIYRKALKHITDNIILDNVSGLEAKLSNQRIKIMQTELILSYFYDLSIIERNLKRDTDTLYKKDYEKKLAGYLTLKSDSRNLTIKNKMIEILDLVFDEVLERFINKKSSIYLSIQKKFDILALFL
jgi:hypothetical protein